MVKNSLSVIICNFNDSHYLNKLFNQIFLQTRLPDEIIFVDDGSTDNSIEIVKAIVKRYKKLNILIFKNSINRGTIYSANFAAKKAKSEYIYFAATDDLFKSNFFEESIKALKKYPDVGLCSSNVFTVDENNLIIKSLPFSLKLHNSCYVSAQQSVKELIRLGPWTGGNSCIYRRTCFLECGGLNHDLKSYSDIFLGMLISVKYGASYISDNFTAFKIRKGSYSSKLSAEESIQIIEKMTILMNKKYKQYFPVRLSSLYSNREIIRLQLHQKYINLVNLLQSCPTNFKNINLLLYFYFLLKKLFFIIQFLIQLPIFNKNFYFVAKKFIFNKSDKLFNALLGKSWEF